MASRAETSRSYALVGTGSYSLKSSPRDVRIIKGELDILAGPSIIRQFSHRALLAFGCAPHGGHFRKAAREQGMKEAFCVSGSVRSLLTCLNENHLVDVPSYAPFSYPDTHVSTRARSQ